MYHFVVVEMLLNNCIWAVGNFLIKKWVCQSVNELSKASNLEHMNQ